MWLIVILATLAYLVYTKIIQATKYWKERNIVHSKPWPLLGNMAPFVFGKQSSQEFILSLYEEFPDERYIGMYAFLRPTLLIRDPDLIKQITVKDFDYFMDRSLFRVNKYTDPILSKNLVSLRGQKWREMRSILSPFFTSSKMKFMFALISECAEDFTKYYEKQGCDVIQVEMKDISSRFTSDAIATTIFGVKVNSLKDRDNEFFLLGTNMTTLDGLTIIRLLGHLHCPRLMKFFKMSAIPFRILQYFSRIVKESIEMRKSHGLVRHDLIHLLLEARKRLELEDNAENLTDDNITAQALTFFFGGFENISTMMSFMAYELAVNPEIQTKLQNEIDETLEQCHGEVTYNALFEMEYLDMVVSETLRKWPAGPLFERLCVKDYVIAPKCPNEKSVIVEKGTTVFIPFGAIHHDPKYFPKPENFDPERFSKDNKSKLVPFSYMPLGVGPRSCIAARYALMEMKIIFFHLLSKFDVVPTEKTSIPLKQRKFKLNLGAEGGIWLGLRRREHCNENNL